MFEGICNNDSIFATWLKSLIDQGIISRTGLADPKLVDYKSEIYPYSINRIGEDTLAIAKILDRRFLLVVGPNRIKFKGENLNFGGIGISICALSHFNANKLRKYFRFTSPSVLSNNNVKVTIGLGDRLGLAGPGHIRAVRNSNVTPILAQQSLRELNLTKRTYHSTIDSATWSVFQENFRSPWAADGDHLKTENSVVEALKCGCTMITADLSDFIHPEFCNMEKHILFQEYEKCDSVYRAIAEEKYLNLKLIFNNNETIGFSKEELARVILTYKDAVDHATRLFKSGKSTKREFDFEISIDEIETPTSPQAHIYVAMEAKRNDISYTSIAPRFVGEFQKGIDYIGDIDDFRNSFKIHASIARAFGYRISVHSGSDKFSVFQSIGELTEGVFHIKTSGTSWLQAMKTISEVEPDFYRKLHKAALEAFPTASQYYKVTPDFENLTEIDYINNENLSSIFDNPDDRRVLHIAYGEILNNKELKIKFFEILEKNVEHYWISIENHIRRHLELLCI